MVEEWSSTRCVLIPSYNSGPILAEVITAVAEQWLPIWVVIDGSTDGSERSIPRKEGINVIIRETNGGKGTAVLAGLQAAAAAGMTHALVMDGDGQHSVPAIRHFMELSHLNPDAMILGRPLFGPDAPSERVKGRRVGNWFANLETLWGGIGDSLFGFRIYPVEDAQTILESIRSARRFDFDTELAVRLYWRGIRPINCDVPVHYPDKARGGVTHFRYFRDNALLVWTHTRLIIGMICRLPKVVNLRRRAA